MLVLLPEEEVEEDEEEEDEEEKGRDLGSCCRYVFLSA